MIQSDLGYLQGTDDGGQLGFGIWTNGSASAVGDPLEKLHAILPWPVFEKPLAKALKRSDGLKVGAAVSGGAMFKILVLQALYKFRRSGRVRHPRPAVVHPVPGLSLPENANSETIRPLIPN
ncbi:hypothetical protein [Sinorhizobium meliloti]|uniref:hypothetical protein n=1 Tax=Rhizobium meliloti TaxID=382 RepID=UPI001AED0539|nr:hypothetical protein [Sinorhizobium meliloti]